MSNELETMLEHLFSLPNWENRGDQHDVKEALKRVHIAFQNDKIQRLIDRATKRLVEKPEILDELIKRLESDDIVE